MTLQFGRKNLKFGRTVESRFAVVFGQGEISSAVERLPYKQDVAGSIPAFPTILLKSLDNFKWQFGRKF